MINDEECKIEFRDPGCGQPMTKDQMSELLAISFGVPYVRDNDDGTYTHTFAPGEDGILNAEIIEE